MADKTTLKGPQMRWHWVDESGECLEDCDGCHFPGNTACDALVGGCDICEEEPPDV